MFEALFYTLRYHHEQERQMFCFHGATVQWERQTLNGYERIINSCWDKSLPSQLHSNVTFPERPSLTPKSKIPPISSPSLFLIFNSSMSMWCCIMYFFVYFLSFPLECKDHESGDDNYFVLNLQPLACSKCSINT